MADDNKPVVPSAPPRGANPAATPNTRQVPGGDAPATAAAAAATGAGPTPHKPVAPRPAAAPMPDLAGKTTSAASAGGAAARTATAPAAKPAATAAGRDADDTSPLLNRRQWLGLAWGAFSAASAAALAATG